MELFLQSYENNGVRTLSGFFAYLENQGMEEIYQQRYFYDFWLILHQRSPVHHGNEDETSGKTVLGEALSSLNGRVLIVTERNIIIQKVDRYSIQDMTFELEGTDDGLFRE